MSADPQLRIYPWNRPQWLRLAQQLDKLPHALLFSGRAGLGKNAFARELARSLLCAQPSPTGEACGACKNCYLFAAGTHPDLFMIAPLEEGKAIMIDQIRSLGEFLTLRPHTAMRKVVVLAPAEAMNLHAANSLLKLLEEPPLGSHFILVCRQAARLAPTILSRCVRVEFCPPPREEGLAWIKSQSLGVDQPDLLLDLADRAPLRALTLAQSDFLTLRRQLISDIQALGADTADPVACAERWKKIGAATCLAWLQTWVVDLIRLSMGGQTPGLSNLDAQSQLQAHTKRLHLKGLFQFLDLVSYNKNLLGNALDELLLLEETLISWVQLIHRESLSR
ncbi:MAG TPA: DNA polymerase III subunit delta' [Acidiferrobacterales bacterium]|nr:DNA polymerase III subunit delta' [Acidiferrobacterales bacterium]